MHKLKIIQISNSLGIVLPDEVLSAMRLKIGDNLFLVESNDGYNFRSEINSQIETAGKVMKKFRSALNQLAN